MCIPDIDYSSVKLNRALSLVDGSGHAYWIDREAGFTAEQQSDLINFLLSLDDEPEVLLDINS